MGDSSISGGAELREVGFEGKAVGARRRSGNRGLTSNVGLVEHLDPFDLYAEMDVVTARAGRAFVFTGHAAVCVGAGDGRWSRRHMCSGDVDVGVEVVAVDLHGTIRRGPWTRLLRGKR